MVKIKRETLKDCCGAEYQHVFLTYRHKIRKLLFYPMQSSPHHDGVYFVEYEKTGGRPKRVGSGYMNYIDLHVELTVAEEEIELSKLLKGKGRAKPKATRL